MTVGLGYSQSALVVAECECESEDLKYGKNNKSVGLNMGHNVNKQSLSNNEGNCCKISQQTTQFILLADAIMRNGQKYFRCIFPAAN